MGSSRERIMNVFTGKEPDRVPLYDLLRNWKAIEYYSGQRLTYDNARIIVPEAISKTLDMTRSIRYPQKKHLKTEDGFTKIYEGWTSWIIERPFKTTEGLSAWIKKDIRRNNFWGFKEDDWLKNKINKYVSQQESIGDTLLLCTLAETWFCDAYTKAGLELFTYLYLDEPALISEWLEAKCERNIKIIEFGVNHKVSPIAFIGEDIASKGATIFSPEFLKKEFFSRVRKSINAFHKKKVKVVFHSDGYLMEVMEDIVNTGADALNPIEPASGMNLRDIKDEYGKKLILIGNIDCSQLLPFASPEEVEEVTRRTIRIAAPGGGYILSSSSELHDGIPLENIKTMHETAKKYGRYSLSGKK